MFFLLVKCVCIGEIQKLLEWPAMLSSLNDSLLHNYDMLYTQESTSLPLIIKVAQICTGLDTKGLMYCSDWSIAKENSH